MNRIVLAVVCLLGLILVGYLSYYKGYNAGRAYTAINDSLNPRTWQSKKWKYEIVFPISWDPIKRSDASVKSPSIDVFCASPRGPSTAVFAYRRFKDETLGEVYNNIVESYRKNYKKLEIIDQQNYTKDNIEYRMILFKIPTSIVDRVYHLTFIANNNTIVFISIPFSLKRHIN